MNAAHEENIKTLMSLTGFSEDEATQRLGLRIAVSAGGGSAVAFASDIAELLGRTVQFSGGSCDIELAVGCAPQTTAPLRLVVDLTEKSMTIHEAAEEEVTEITNVPGLTRKIAACYAAGYILARAIGASQLNGALDLFVFNFENLALPLEKPFQPIVLEDAVLVGAGGVANGFLWAAQELPLEGRLYVVDPKKIRHGNLNRCLFFDEVDLDRNKAEVLAEKFQSPGLEVEGVVGTFKEFRAGRPDGRIKRVITTVDSRRVRRSVQSELPLEVLDASTTDITEIIVHSHRQPNPHACLSCIYPHIPQENQREQHIADALGISLAEVQQGFIDRPLAHKLATIHSGLVEDNLIGIALDTLFKQKCGEGTLITPAGKQAAAPFAFISNLAGALLALELVLFVADTANGNYLALDPWRPPHKRLRRIHGKLTECEFCSKPESAQAMRLVWPEYFEDDAE